MQLTLHSADESYCADWNSCQLLVLACRPEKHQGGGISSEDDDGPVMADGELYYESEEELDNAAWTASQISALQVRCCVT